MKRKSGKSQRGHKAQPLWPWISTDHPHANRFRTRRDYGRIPTKLAMQFRTLKWDAKEWENNPLGGRYTPEKWEEFINQINREGVKEPIWVQRREKDAVIHNGEHRRRAAYFLGHKKIKVTLIHGNDSLIYHPRLKPYGMILPKKRKAK